jgi:lipoyl(octanoyl) transferase
MAKKQIMLRPTPQDLIQSATPSAHRSSDLIIAELGCVHYHETLQAMQKHAIQRTPKQPDQIWILEHFPVYTRGSLSRDSDILAPLPYPLIDTDRGGKITYHGPGQLVVYFLMHMTSMKQLSSLMQQIENIAITLLAQLQINAQADSKHRGVYVQQEKIASVGLRVKNNNTYHGLALNVAMDLNPFQHIQPCGRMQDMCQIKDFTPTTMSECSTRIKSIIASQWPNKSIKTKP